MNNLLLASIVDVALFLSQNRHTPQAQSRGEGEALIKSDCQGRKSVPFQ